MSNLETWLRGLLAAAIGAAATGISTMVADPTRFNFSRAGLAKLGEVCAVSAAIAVATYLKQSPLPGASTTLTATKTVNVTGATQEATDALAASVAQQPMTPKENPHA